ncbi:TRAM domain-containing protein [Halobium palmae]|uniref:TRAM domain-containing protein n=1 Tax=Halobium palmae TaxID=1776492 RepID=A0ABD5RWF9_9EURY
MADIPDSLRLLFETSLERDGDRYVVPVPSELVDDGALSPEESYRIALLASVGSETGASARRAESAESASDGSDSDDRAESTRRDDAGMQSPPVEEGEVRSVVVDTLGDQGDGIARVERGFIVIIPGTKPGDEVDVEITDVKQTVAFAEPVSEATVR